MTEWEKSEILGFDDIYFFGTSGIEKVKGSCLEEHNNGFDDKEGDYKIVEGDHIAYRYEVKEILGSGSFGQVVKVFDHKVNETMALKIIKNSPKFEYQAQVEVQILKHLKDNDPYDKQNIIQMKEVTKFRNHLCVTFELLSINLYDFLKAGDFRGLSTSLI